MFEGWNIGVVVPARDEEEFLPEVLSTMPSIVDLVVVVVGAGNRLRRMVARPVGDRVVGCRVGLVVDGRDVVVVGDRPEVGVV